jgi:glycosyltransferase involved in cell wall biosynthesis
MLNRLHTVIALSRAEAAEFQTMTAAPVHFVPHGVDANFFVPKSSGTTASAAHAAPRCLFVGNWLRDFPTLQRCAERLLTVDRQIQIDIVAPERADRSDADEQAPRALVKRERVHWHRGIDDTTLRGLYQHATVLLLPLHASTANNAVLEALACGLPVVSNHTTGILDYTSGDCAVLTDRSDACAMADVVLQLAGDPARRREMSSAARSLVEQRLRWSVVARQVMALYQAG